MIPKDLKPSDYTPMIEQFHSESDRGAAVLAGSYVENLLGTDLENKMSDNSQRDSVFDSNGPLSTFSQRIIVGQAFGLIEKETAEALNYVRKIRNHFAHYPFEASFEKEPVSNWVVELRSLLPLREDQEETRGTMGNRHVYLITCAIFSASVHLTMDT